MRNLAQHLGIKAPSLYRHYASKEALEQAMNERGTVELRTQIEQTARGYSGKQVMLRAAHTYLGFARQRPQLYALMMAQPSLPVPSGKDLWNTLLALVGQVSGNPDDTAAAVAVWAYLHGFVVLEQSGMFGESGPQGGFERGLQALLNGM